MFRDKLMISDGDRYRRRSVSWLLRNVCVCVCVTMNTMVGGDVSVLWVAGILHLVVMKWHAAQLLISSSCTGGLPFFGVQLPPQENRVDLLQQSMAGKLCI